MPDLPGGLPPGGHPYGEQYPGPPNVPPPAVPSPSPPPPPENRQVQHVEVSTPLWRVFAVICTAAAIAALAYYLNAVHHADDFATVAVITMAYSVSFWARQRPDRVQRRFGPFGKIATAIRDSQDDLRGWVYRQPLRAGVLIAVGYGVAVVIGKHIVIAIVHGLWSPWLAVAIGAAVGAVVAAPRMFADLGRRIVGSQRPEGQPPQPPGP